MRVRVRVAARVRVRVGVGARVRVWVWVRRGEVRYHEHIPRIELEHGAALCPQPEERHLHSK